MERASISDGTSSDMVKKISSKFLMGITPQGSISFVSQVWDGHVSDGYLTEHCGILENLKQGNLILAVAILTMVYPNSGTDSGLHPDNCLHPDSGF